MLLVWPGWLAPCGRQLGGGWGCMSGPGAIDVLARARIGGRKSEEPGWGSPASHSLGGLFPCSRLLGPRVYAQWSVPYNSNGLRQFHSPSMPVSHGHFESVYHGRSYAPPLQGLPYRRRTHPGAAVIKVVSHHQVQRDGIDSNNLPGQLSLLTVPPLSPQTCPYAPPTAAAHGPCPVVPCLGPWMGGLPST